MSGDGGDNLCSAPGCTNLWGLYFEMPDGNLVKFRAHLCGFHQRALWGLLRHGFGFESDTGRKPVMTQQGESSDE